MYSWELKLNRALRYLKAIDDEVGMLLDRCEKGIRSEIYRHEGSDFYTGIIRAPSDTGSDELNLLVGECVYHLRSALDHLVAHMVAVNGGKVTTSTQFPIFNTEPGWTHRGLSQIKGMPEPQFTRLKVLQPYHSGQDAHRTPLWLLRELSNWDKHHALTFSWTNIFVNDIDIRDAKGFEHVGTEIVREQGAIMPNAELARLHFRATEPHAKVTVQPHLTLNVSFGHGSGPAVGELVVDTLARIYATVRDEVVPAFEPIPSGVYVHRTSGFERNPTFRG